MDRPYLVIPVAQWHEHTQVCRWSGLPGVLTQGLGEQSPQVLSSVPADTLGWAGPGPKLEDQPPGPLPQSSLLYALGNLTVPAQFKVQTVELYTFAGLAAVGPRDPGFVCFPGSAWLW